MHDTDVQVESPAVTEARKLFLQLWLKQKGPDLSEQDYVSFQPENGPALVRVVGSTPGQDNRITFDVFEQEIPKSLPK